MPAGGQVTMKQIAEALSLSIPTVSLVLNQRADECRISAETQKRVLDQAAKMGYGLPKRPQHRRSLILASASQLAQGGMGRGPLADVLPVLTDQLIEQGWVVRLAMDTAQNVFGVSDRMLAEAGAVLVPVHGKTLDAATALAHRAAKKGVLPIMAGHLHPDINCLSIDKDNYGGGRLIAEHLHDRGHRDVAVVCGPDAHPHSGQRLRGFCEIFAARGHPVPARRIWRADSFKLTVSHRVIRNKIDRNDLPSAIFFMGDGMALGGYYALRELQITVPDEISIVGFDDSWGLDDEDLALTTVRIDAEAVKDSVAATLISMVEGNGPLRAQILCPARLVVRSTTRDISE